MLQCQTSRPLLKKENSAQHGDFEETRHVEALSHIAIRSKGTQVLTNNLYENSRRDLIRKQKVCCTSNITKTNSYNELKAPGLLTLAEISTNMYKN